MLGLLSGKINWLLVPPRRERQTRQHLCPFPGSSSGDEVSGTADTQTHSDAALKHHSHCHSREQ